MLVDSEDEYPTQHGDAFIGTDDFASPNATMTTKIPPAYNGRSSWFAYEELIDEWVDLTVINPEKQGPNLRNRLIEDAQMYKAMLDRNRLMDPDNGVQYFKDTLRRHFVKGKEHVFLWRFLLFFRCYRGNQDMTRWIGRFIITRKRVADAWMDLIPDYNINEPTYRADVGAQNAALAAAGQNPNVDPDDPAVFDAWLAANRRRHQNAFPLSDHLMTMMFIVAADLSESQRERLVSTMSVRGIQLAAYTFDVISQVFREIFCATKTGIADPNLRPTTSQGTKARSFCILEEGDWEGDFGMWVQDDETGEEGFVNLTDEIFWTHDDTSAAFVARPVKGRAFRRGWPKFQPRKGKGKGSRGRFRSHRKGKAKGKRGKGKGYYGEEDQDSSYFGKGKGKKGKKGKKSQSHDGETPGKGKSESLQVKTEPTTSTKEADSFWSEDSWWTEDVWWTNDSSWGYDDWSYLVIERSEQSPEHSALLSSFQMIDIRKSPTYVILDSGCTRCLGSRPRVMAFVDACRTRGTNMKFEFVPCQTKFSFANSRTARVYERLIIHFDTKPPCKTEIDILEEGTVPILLSIQQMRQLYMTFEHTPECDYLTCKAFGMHRHPLPISNTNHIVLDLASLKQNPHVMLTHGLEEDVLLSRTAHVVNEESVFKTNEIPNHPVRKEGVQQALALGERFEDLPVEKRCPACRGQHRPHRKDLSCKKFVADFMPPIVGQPQGEKKESTAEEKNESKEPDLKKSRRLRRADYDKAIVGTGGQNEPSTSSSSSSRPAAPAVSSRDAPEEEVSPEETTEQREISPSTEAVLPLALDRIRQRLDNDVELHKLHLKHHHMNTLQFKQRTSALKLPASVYQRYDQIVKSCEVCQKVKGTPARSKISGMRAEVFGELIFIDHGEVREGEQTYLFFLILDGATNLVTAFVQKTATDAETQENFREHMHQLQFRPKAVVGDQAFHTPSWETFYRTRGIKPVSIGPGTPWPNRAEAAVRLFKHQVKLMFAEIKTNPVYRDITPRELFREACWARNTAVTYGGKTPLELAFGRRPPDILDAETSSPQQLTTENLPADERVKQLQQLAMKCHLEARQAKDIRQDIASSLRFSHGPFSVGDKVWYFEHDPNKIKGGKKEGSWTRAKVIGVDGSMIGIDLGNRIIRVNESKLRKDHDHFSDINVPLDAEPSAPVEPPPGLDTTDDAVSTFVQDGSISFAHVLWQVCTKGKIDVLELFAGSARISQCSAQEGLSVGQPVDLRTGFDLNTSRGQRMTMQIITDQQPDVVFMAPVCAPWCNWSHMKPYDQKMADRKKAMPMVQFVIRVAKYQLSQGRHFIIENPYGSDLWKLKEFVNLLLQPCVSYGKLDMCAYGMKDPVSHDYYYKPTCLVHSFPSGVLDPVFKECPNKNRSSDSNNHRHEQIQGWCKGHGRRSSLAQVYPYPFCKRLSHCIATYLQVKPQDKHSFLISDILDLCIPSSWCSTLKEALENRSSGQWEVLSSVSEHGQPTSIPISVSDPVVKKLIVKVNSMPSNTEILLHTEPWTPYIDDLGKMTIHLRKLYLPHHVFGKCSILRGTFGSAFSARDRSDLAFVIMWRKHDETKQLYVVSMPSMYTFPSSFEPRKWSMVLFWQESSLPGAPVFADPDIPMEAIPPDQQIAPPPDAEMPFPQPVYADPDMPILMDQDPPLDEQPEVFQPPPGPPPGAPPSNLAPVHVQVFTPVQPSFVPPALPIQPSDPVVTLQSLPPVPHENQELELMDDMPDTGFMPNKRPLHPPPPDSTAPSRTQRLAGDVLRPISSPSLCPSPSKRQTIRFETPDEQPLLPLRQDDEDDLPQPSTSSSSSTTHQQQTTSPDKKTNDDSDDNTEPVPQRFRLDENDDSDDDDDDARTVDYGDLVKDLYIDEDEWQCLTADHKLCSMTGSFTIPRDAYGNAIDVTKTYTTSRTLRNIKQSLQPSFPSSKCSKADLVEDYSLLTDDDQSLIHLCFEASGLTVKDSALAATNNKLKKRKEASQSEKRQYAKQFAEAKQAEYQSWVDNNVFDLIDIRKTKCKNYVTGRWVLTIKRNKEGEFQKCKARWVLRGFQDRQKDAQQTDSPAATRPGFRLAAQVAANNHWDLFHIDLKTAFLQGEAYDETRDIICELPKEAGLPWYTCARMKKPAYGLNDAPRRWWNIVDEKLRSYHLQPTRADRCCYVLYDSSTTKGTDVSRVPMSGPSSFDDALNYLLDPVTGSNAKGRKVLGVVCLHVDDLFLAGNQRFHAQVCQNLRKDFSIGSEDTNDIQFVGQRIKWIMKDGKKHYIRVDQHLAIEELEEIKFDKSLKDDVGVTPSMHTEYRSVLGQINWLQSRTQYHACYKFSRCASQASNPTIGDVRALNKLVRQLRSQPVTLNFWPLDQPCRILGFPDASYKNNEDKSSQRAHCIFLAASRSKHSAQADTYGSLVDYESHKITATTMSTTVAELYALMKCFGTCQFIRGLWADLSGEAAPIHIRTDANNLVTTASTTHVPEQKETIHLIQMLRKESGSGNIEDLAHVKSEYCLSDALTKHSAKPDELIRAVETGLLRQVDTHPPFRSLLKHKAYLCLWITKFVKEPLKVVSFLGEDVQQQVLQSWYQQ